MKGLALLVSTTALAATAVAAEPVAILRHRSALEAVVRFAETSPELFPPERPAAPRVLAERDREAVRAAWKRLLDNVLALDSVGLVERDRLVRSGLRDSEALVAAYAAFVAEYRFAMEWIERVDRDESLAPLLDEDIPELGLPKGTYARLKFRFLNVARGGEFLALESAYQLLPKSTGEALRAAIDADRAAIWKTGRGKGELMTAKNGLSMLKNAGFSAYFPVQAGISEWMGDTKVYRPEVALISSAQLAGLTLEPGDILLERREWYLSNIGLPGFWPHVALYIGTPDERRRYFDDGETNAWVTTELGATGSFDRLIETREAAAFELSRRPTADRHPVRLIEAISEGVVFTSLEHSAHCDSLAVLRPRLSKRAKAEAILRALHFAGRPYDFDFDFRTDSTLVCTELAYKAYEPLGLTWSLVEMLGRPVLPANQIAIQFDRDYGTPRQSLDLIAFLDGDERGKRAVVADLAAFRTSHRRPKWHIVFPDASH